MNDLPLYLLRPGFDGLLADRWREFAQDNPDLFVELDVSRLSTDIEEIISDAMHSDWRGICEEITSENKDFPVVTDLRRELAERIAGLLTQPRGEK